MTYREIRNKLATLYGNTEATAVIDLTLYDMFKLSKADVLCGAVEKLSNDDMQKLDKAVSRLMKFEPVQYVLGHASFCSREFQVNRNVLIPRPETEELCSWIIDDNSEQTELRILDIGTGSGCIACTLALDMRSPYVEAWDISVEALAVAHDNATRLGANVVFKQRDALFATSDCEQWDVIVSNPPYICCKEQSTMQRNVTDYEPHSALFVPDNDPLKFYRAIANYASSALKRHGQLFYEVNPLYANQVVDMLKTVGFTAIETRNDQYGKLRMIKGYAVMRL